MSPCSTLLCLTWTIWYCDKKWFSDCLQISIVILKKDKILGCSYPCNSGGAVQNAVPRPVTRSRERKSSTGTEQTRRETGTGCWPKARNLLERLQHFEADALRFPNDPVVPAAPATKLKMIFLIMRSRYRPTENKGCRLPNPWSYAFKAKGLILWHNCRQQIMLNSY